MSDARRSKKQPDASKKEDPWPLLEPEMQPLLTELVACHQRYRSLKKGTEVDGARIAAAEHELLEELRDVEETLADMQESYDIANDHPDLFSIVATEMNRRLEKLRQWGRAMQKPQNEAKSIAKAQQAARRAAASMDRDDPAHSENVDYIRSQQELQQREVVTQEEVLVRLHHGIVRVKDSAVVINDELVVQEKMLSDVEKDMSVAQKKVEDAVKKVGKLLDQSSDRSKIICIVVLLIIVFLLIAFVMM